VPRDAPERRGRGRALPHAHLGRSDGGARPQEELVELPDLLRGGGDRGGARRDLGVLPRQDVPQWLAEQQLRGCDGGGKDLRGLELEAPPVEGGRVGGVRG
jgi:hypothetical protein